MGPCITWWVNATGSAVMTAALPFLPSLLIWTMFHHVDRTDKRATNPWEAESTSNCFLQVCCRRSYRPTSMTTCKMIKKSTFSMHCWLIDDNAPLGILLLDTQKYYRVLLWPSSNSAPRIIKEIRLQGLEMLFILEHVKQPHRIIPCSTENI